MISDPGLPPPVRASGAAPIIVTATMGAADQRFFDALRAAHFPPFRNRVPAHITLFHQLPPSSLDELKELVRRMVADTPPPAAMIADVYSLGTGVAFRIESPALLAMGLGLMAVGAALAALVFANWSYILSVTKNSVAAAAGGAAAASLLALMGLALVYASREVRLSPCCRP